MPVTFTKAKLPFGWLGNMTRYPLNFEGQQWHTAEALFQALRFQDLQVREAIRVERSPMRAKMIAHAHADQMTVEPASAADLANMELVLRLKLAQHPKLQQALLETCDQQIIEDVTRRTGSGRHAFWGMALRSGEWVGENALGKIWMKLREELKASDKR